MTAHYSWNLVDKLAVLALLCLAFVYFFRKNGSAHLPPSLKPLPIIGNLLDMPRSFAWIHYQRWAALYGDVFTMTVFGKVIIVLNSHTAIQEVALRSHPSVFSSRPPIKFAEMIGESDRDIVFMPHGRRWRDRRRIIDKNFKPAAIQVYQPVLQEKAANAVDRIARDPMHFVQHIREYAGAAILSIVYGYDVQDPSDKFVKAAEESAAVIGRALMPGYLVVNTLPVLGRLPPWTLGLEFSRLVKKAMTIQHALVHDPFQWVKDSVTQGTAKMSLVREALTEIPEDNKEAELAYIEAFGVVYGAAADTSVSALSTFVLAMAQYPDIQARAQVEIDIAIGRGRPIAFGDRQSLPYIDALLMEVLRWRPVTPQGVPHFVCEDYVWRGYVIPKGATVIGNTWAILHDPISYPDPDTFKPERFLSADKQVITDPKLEYAFGFGARRCPGRHFADSAIWIFVANVLSAFNIRKLGVTESTQNEHLYQDLYSGEGLIIHPLPFDCHITPRDK